MTATVTGELGTVYEVGSGLYSYVQPDGSWCINTSAFVVGAESVTMIDTCATERRTRALLEAIRATTDVPVGVLVLTHHHIDHVNGNGLVGARTIFGHDRCRARMLKPSEPPSANHIDPVEWGAIDPVPPDVTFTDRLDLWRDAGRI